MNIRRDVLTWIVLSTSVFTASAFAFIDKNRESTSRVERENDEAQVYVTYDSKGQVIRKVSGLTRNVFFERMPDGTERNFDKDTGKLWRLSGSSGVHVYDNGHLIQRVTRNYLEFFDPRTGNRILEVAGESGGGGWKSVVAYDPDSSEEMFRIAEKDFYRATSFSGKFSSCSSADLESYLKENLRSDVLSKFAGINPEIEMPKGWRKIMVRPLEPKNGYKEVIGSPVFSHINLGEKFPVSVPGSSKKWAGQLVRVALTSEGVKEYYEFTDENGNELQKRDQRLLLDRMRLLSRSVETPFQIYDRGIILTNSYKKGFENSYRPVAAQIALFLRDLHVSIKNACMRAQNAH